MSRTLEFYFDFSSPFAYLASTQIEAVAARTGAALVWRPMLLGAVFRQVGTVDVPLNAMSAPRRQMYLKDMHRWAEHWGVPLHFPSHFPMNTVQALRCYLVLEQRHRSGGDHPERRFLHATFRALCVDDEDISSTEVLSALIHGIGVGPGPVLEAIGSQEVKDALRAATARAVEAGVFGAPTCIVDGRYLFWGQDRLGMVEQTLRGWNPPF